MRGVVMHAPGDVRVEDREDPRDRRADRRGSSVWPRPASAGPTCGPTAGIEPVDHPPMGHEYVGVVEEVGDDVKNVKVGDFVVGSFVISDNTCEICQAGYQSNCVHAEFVHAAIGTQAEKARIPHADGTLVATPGSPTPT